MTDEVVSTLLFVVPGLLSVYIRSHITDLPRKREEWRAKLSFLLFSIASWYALYLVSVFIFVGSILFGIERIKPINITIDSITGLYLGIPAFALVLIISGLLGFIFAYLDIKEVHERVFSSVRGWFGLAAENRKDLWSELILEDKVRLAHIVYGQNDRSQWGIIDQASTDEDSRFLYIFPLDGEVIDNDSFPKSAGMLIDLKGGFSVELFEFSELTEKANLFRKEYEILAELESHSSEQ